MPFQFHKGAIRTRMQITCSLKVLLFQFHKGAIRTRLPTKIQPDVSLFQFHKGAIRTGVQENQMKFNYISIP